MAKKQTESEETGEWVPGDQAPFTTPIPQTGEGDMTSSPQPSNEPSVPGVELPASVHDHSGGKVHVVRVAVEDD